MRFVYLDVLLRLQIGDWYRYSAVKVIVKPFLQVVESGPLRSSVKITVPLAEHGDIVVIATVMAEIPYLTFKTDVSQPYSS